MILFMAFSGPRLRSSIEIGGIGTRVGTLSVGVSIVVSGDMVDV
jgi:hypothetical protein